MNRKIAAAVLIAAVSLGSIAALAAGPGDERPAGSAPAAQEEVKAPAEERDGQEAPAAEGGEAAAEPDPEPVPEPGPKPEPDPDPDPEGTVSFANLGSRVRAGNLNSLILQENIDSIEAVDYDKLKEDLRDGLNLSADLIWNMKTMGGAGGSIAAQSLQSSYDAMREQFDDLKEGKIQADAAAGVRQLKNAQDSIVMAVEGLFVQLKELEATDASLGRSLSALDRQIQELELRYKLGQISALTLQQAKAGRTSLVSGRQTLRSSIQTAMMNLKSLLGEELTEELELGALPQVTDAQLDRMDLEQDLAAARETSYALFAAKKALDDAQEDYRETGRDYGYNSDKYQFIQAKHAWQAAQYTYEAAEQSFELSFRTLYGQIQDYRQVLAASRTALALEEDNYAVDQLKYEQGTISKNALLTAKDDLSTAQDAVETAKRDLFSAYHNYRWAVDYGILN